MARLFDDAQSEYLEVNQAVVVAAPFAISAWVYPDDVTAELAILCLGDSAVHGEYWKLAVRGNVVPDPVVFQALGRRANTTTGVTINTWHHACGIEIANNSRAAFIDGGSKGTNVVAEAPTPDRTAIGRECDSTPTFYFSGGIAEVGVWDLTGWPGATAADKAAAFEATALPALAAGYSALFFMLGLKAYWSLIRDEDQDRVGGYDMTAFNAPSIAAHPPIIYPAPPSFFMAPAGAPPVSAIMNQIQFANLGADLYDGTLVL